MQNSTYKDYFRPYFNWGGQAIGAAGVKISGLVIINEHGHLYDTIEKPGTKPWIFVGVWVLPLPSEMKVQWGRYVSIVTDLDVWAQCEWVPECEQRPLTISKRLSVVNNTKREEIEFLTYRDRDTIQDAFRVYTHGDLPQLPISQVTSALHKACTLQRPNSQGKVRWREIIQM